VLEPYLRERQRQRGILLMTHIVAGYPSFDASLRLVEAMVLAGVDLIELQIPFSEPIADGPVILHANQEALSAGATVERCLALASEVSHRFDIPFLFMSYFNILFRRGIPEFVSAMRTAGMKGAIVPDLPPESGPDGRAYLEAMRAAALDAILIYAPTTPVARLTDLGKAGGGFVYCVARKGVTGSATRFSSELDTYLQRAREATTLPLAVGFGITSRADVDHLRGKADIAVVGSETLRVLDKEGVDGVGRFIRDLRPSAA
jgi:tryptophan synthase alpha chain